MSSSASYDPSPLERLVLWRLSALPDGEWVRDLKPALTPVARQRLKAHGFIDVDDRKPPDRPRKQLHVRLADGGWRWCDEHLGSEVSSRSTAGGEVLRMFLARLKGFLTNRSMSLGELMTAAAPDHVARVESAYRRLAVSGNVRVRLADLRPELPDLPRPQLDDLLLKLERDGRLSLDPINDPHDLGPADREAVLRTPAGAERHILCYRGR